ncbi:MAG: hypothetical protein ACPG7F_15790 [Aggregatilineales bacterium]
MTHTSFSYQHRAKRILSVLAITVPSPGHRKKSIRDRKQPASGSL